MDASRSAPQWMGVPERAVGGDRECASHSVSVALSSAATTRTPRASAGTDCVFLARLRLPTALRQAGVGDARACEGLRWVGALSIVGARGRSL